jgi:hypothetical protein
MKRNPLQFGLALLILTVFSFDWSSLAISGNAIQCHCFTERDYNPAERFAADDYILATSFNSLLARLTGLPKSQIVMIKMKEGLPQDDLLISLQAAKISGQKLQDILDLRRAGEFWPEIIANLPRQDAVKKNEILKSITAGTSVDVAGAGVADEMMTEFYALPADEMNKLKISGLNPREINLILILNHVSEIQPDALAALYTKQGRSWSEISYNLGLTPKETGKLVLAYPSKSIPEND